MRRIRFGRWLALLLVVGVGLSVPGTVTAQEGEAPATQTAGHDGLGFGLRAGFGIDPDQFVFGAQYSLGRAFKYARFVPSIDVGAGSGTTIAFNADFLFRAIIEGSRLGFYAGGGPTLAYAEKSGNSDWEPGITVTLGVALPLIPNRGTNLEARFGVFDIPDFRLLFAFIF